MSESPTGNTAPVIALDRVSKRFGATTALHETSLRIGEGEFFSLLGPSGCGKTTTLRLIAGFERPSDGRVLLDGADVSGVPPYRRDVNTVFQQYALFPHLSVFDNVAFGLRSRKVPQVEVGRRVRALLEVVRLPDLAGRRPAQLSGGQQQRVALARALVNRPRALLLDEPLGALDLKLRESMQTELKRIQQELGTTFVYVTHDQAEALAMSDRIAVMDGGRVCPIGSPREVYDRPANRFVATFIGTSNLVTTADGLVAVRPERMTLEALDTERSIGPGVEATVTAAAFLGAVVRCTCVTPEGTELLVDVDAGADTALARPGDRVWVAWHADDAVALPPDDGSAVASDRPEIRSALGGVPA